MRSIVRAVTGCALVAAVLVIVSSQGVADVQQQKGNPPVAPPRPASLNRVTQRLEQLIPRLLQEGTVPGLSIALIRDGKLAWQHGFGLANADTKAPVTNDSVFEAASLSKPVFAYGVLKLIDAGQLDLDRPLVTYLPGRYDVGDDPRFDRLTARHVLSHTSGFPNWRSGAREGPLPMFFSPGERFSYSGEGFVYLGKVVEHITGESLDQYMKRAVFDPLGMTSSSYVWQDRYETLKVSNHNAFGIVTPSGRPKTPNMAASLQTTSGDYARFVVAILNGVGLKKRTAKAMLSTQSRVDEAGPNTVQRAPTGRVVPGLSWGLGWALEDGPDGPAFWHWGDNGNNKAFVYVREKSRTGVAIFADGSNGLSIVPEIVKAAVGGEHPAFAWLRIEPYDSPVNRFFRTMVDRGVPQGLQEYRARKTAGKEPLVVTEDQMNQFGYGLLSAKRVEDAIEVFKLNVEEHPESWNTYDSLGEAYTIHGDAELAIRNYERSVELNPENKNGIEQLKKLKGK
jgi:CubicO group peptidase (beta-lactamase class C family)